MRVSHPYANTIVPIEKQVLLDAGLATGHHRETDSTGHSRPSGQAEPE